MKSKYILAFINEFKYSKRTSYRQIWLNFSNDRPNTICFLYTLYYIYADLDHSYWESVIMEKIKKLLHTNRHSFLVSVIAVVLPILGSLLSLYVIFSYPEITEWVKEHAILFFLGTAFTMAVLLTPTTFIASLSGFLFGLVAWRTRSFFYPFLIHWFVATFTILVAGGAIP